MQVNNHATHLFNSILEENPNYTEKQILDRGRCLLQSALRSRLHYETMLLCDKLDVSRDDLINGCREQPLATKRAVIAAILVEKRYSITSVYNELHLHNSTVHHALGVVRDGLEVGDKLIMELYRKGKE